MSSAKSWQPAPRLVDVAMIIADLAGGGAQKVVAHLAEAWTAQGRRVAVVTFDDGRADRQRLPLGVHRVALSGSARSPHFLGGALANVERVLSLRRVLKELGPSVALSFIAPTNVLVILATRGLDMRVVVSERNDPARQSFGRIWDSLRHWTYRSADIVTANSRGALRTLGEFVPDERLRYAPNPLPPLTASPAVRPRTPLILAVGRLHPQKGYDVLLDAFAQLHVRHPDWRLAVCGEGPLGERLQQQTRERGLDGAIDWLGYQEHPFDICADATIYVLPSRYEGTPNALMEAMQRGLACIITDSSPGPLELVTDGVSGLVVPTGDSKALADALLRLVGDADLRERLSTEAARVAHQLELSNALAEWNAILWPATDRS